MERLTSFLFPIESDKWLGLLRLGLGLQVAIYSLALRGDWLLLFTGHGVGLVSRDIEEGILDLHGKLIPRLDWLVWAGVHLHLSEEAILQVAWWCLLGASFFLVAGLFSRPAALVTWFLHLCAVKSSNLFAYGMDNFTTIGLFYLLLAPLPDRFALDHWWRNKPSKDARLLGFFRRILQLHLCVIYFFGGLTKALGAGWWNGSSIWRALTCPPFDRVPIDWLLEFRYLLPVAGIAVCLLELGYPIFIWGRRTRAPWLLAVVLMHLMIGLTMNLYLFTSIMIILNLAAFADARILTLPAWSRAFLVDDRPRRA